MVPWGLGISSEAFMLCYLPEMDDVDDGAANWHNVIRHLARMIAFQFEARICCWQKFWCVPARVVWYNISRRPFFGFDDLVCSPSSYHRM